MSEPTTSLTGTEDLERGLYPTSLRRLPVLLTIAVVALLLFNSQGLHGWTQRLPSSPRNEWIAARAADWHERMQQLGFAWPMSKVRDWLLGQEGSRL